MLWINNLWNVNLSKEHFIRKSSIKVTSEKATLKYNLSSAKLKLKYVFSQFCSNFRVSNSGKKLSTLPPTRNELYCIFCSLEFSEGRVFHEHEYKVHRNIISREWLQEKGFLSDILVKNKTPVKFTFQHSMSKVVETDNDVSGTTKLGFLISL